MDEGRQSERTEDSGDGQKNRQKKEKILISELRNI